jgi:hypothetical protein
VDKPSPKVHANAVLTARLAYAEERKWPTFAAPVAGKNLKQSIKWSCPETNNVNWGATLDPDVIRAEFNGKLFFGKSLRNAILASRTHTLLQVWITAFSFSFFSRSHLVFISYFTNFDTSPPLAFCIYTPIHR